MFWDGGWHMWWMTASWAIGFALLVVFVWVLARGMAFGRTTPQEDTPEVILKRRYARGEIGADEYERRLTDLRR
jgi:putative membrane protein